MLGGKLWMVLVDASCYVVKKSMYVWIYRGTKKNFCWSSTKCQNFDYVACYVLSNLFYSVYQRNNDLLFKWRDRFVSTKKSIFASTVCNSFCSLVKPARYFLRVSQKDWKYWKFTIIDDTSLTSIFTSLHHWKAWIWCQSPSILDPIDIGCGISRRSTIQKSCCAFFHHFQFRISGYTWEPRRQISLCKRIPKSN